MIYNVFVYGTLKTGFHNHYLLKKSKYLGNACTVERYTLLEDWLTGLPYVVKEKNSIIFGEMYNVDKQTLKKLDKLEGHPHFYKRELQNFYTYDSDYFSEDYVLHCKAWIYFLSPYYDLRNTKTIENGIFG